MSDDEQKIETFEEKEVEKKFVYLVEVCWTEGSHFEVDSVFDDEKKAWGRAMFLEVEGARVKKIEVNGYKTANFTKKRTRGGQHPSIVPPRTLLSGMQ